MRLMWGTSVVYQISAFDVEKKQKKVANNLRLKKSGFNFQMRQNG